MHLQQKEVCPKPELGVHLKLVYINPILAFLLEVFQSAVTICHSPGQTPPSPAVTILECLVQTLNSHGFGSPLFCAGSLVFNLKPDFVGIPYSMRPLDSASLCSNLLHLWAFLWIHSPSLPKICLYWVSRERWVWKHDRGIKWNNPTSGSEETNWVKLWNSLPWCGLDAKHSTAMPTSR